MRVYIIHGVCKERRKTYEQEKKCVWKNRQKWESEKIDELKALPYYQYCKHARVIKTKHQSWWNITGGSTTLQQK